MCMGADAIFDESQHHLNPDRHPPRVFQVGHSGEWWYPRSTEQDMKIYMHIGADC